MVTAVGLTCACAEFFAQYLPFSYKTLVFITGLFSMVVSNLGLSHLIQISIPVLTAIYPPCIVLVVLSFTLRWWHSAPRIIAPVKRCDAFAAAAARTDGADALRLLVLRCGARGPRVSAQADRTGGNGASHIRFMALGSAIGTGLFYGSADAIKMAGPSVLLAYLIGGIVAFIIMRALGRCRSTTRRPARFPLRAGLPRPDGGLHHRLDLLL